MTMQNIIKVIEAINQEGDIENGEYGETSSKELDFDKISIKQNVTLRQISRQEL